MELVLGLLKTFVSGIFLVLEIAMLVRALLSWFPDFGGGAIETLVYTITEPVIMPVRSILDRFDSLRNFPFDLSFLVTLFIIGILEMLLF